MLLTKIIAKLRIRELCRGIRGHGCSLVELSNKFRKNTLLEGMSHFRNAIFHELFISGDALDGHGFCGPYNKVTVFSFDAHELSLHLKS